MSDTRASPERICAVCLEPCEPTEVGIGVHVEHKTAAPYDFITVYACQRCFGALMKAHHDDAEDDGLSMEETFIEWLRLYIADPPPHGAHFGTDARDRDFI